MDALAKKDITEKCGIYSSFHGNEEEVKPFSLQLATRKFLPDNPLLFLASLLHHYQQQLQPLPAAARMPILIPPPAIPHLWAICPWLPVPSGSILLAISSLPCRDAGPFHQMQPGWRWRSLPPAEVLKVGHRLFLSANKPYHSQQKKKKKLLNTLNFIITGHWVSNLSWPCLPTFYPLANFFLSSHFL